MRMRGLDTSVGISRYVRSLNRVPIGIPLSVMSDIAIRVPPER